MECDAREQRLRAGFGWMMVRTAAVVWIVGFALGQLLVGAGSMLGYPLDESSAAVLRLSGHPIAGVFVLVALFRAYLAPAAGTAGR